MAAGDNYRRIEPSDQLVFDSAGALVGIRSGTSDGAELRPGPTQVFGESSVLLVGDSITSYAWDLGPTVTAIVDNGNGTATITFNASHNWAVGGRITVNNSPLREFNEFSAEVTAIVNANPYTVTYRIGGRTSPVVGASASSTQTLYMGRYSPLGYAAWLEALVGRRLSFVLAAAGGADSAQALRLFEDAARSALAARCQDTVLMIGTNDVFARGLGFAAAQTQIATLMVRVREAMPGKLWVLMPPPMGSGAAAWSAGKQTVLNRVIRWLWRYSIELGATPIDTWRGAQNGSTLVNPAASNPDPTSNFLGADATHPTNLGALAIARALYARWATVQPSLGIGFRGGIRPSRTRAMRSPTRA